MGTKTTNKQTKKLGSTTTMLFLWITSAFLALTVQSAREKKNQIESGRNERGIGRFLKKWFNKRPIPNLEVKGFPVQIFQGNGIPHDLHLLNGIYKYCPRGEFQRKRGWLDTFGFPTDIHQDYFWYCTHGQEQTELEDEFSARTTFLFLIRNAHNRHWMIRDLRCTNEAMSVWPVGPRPRLPPSSENDWIMCRVDATDINIEGDTDMDVEVGSMQPASISLKHVRITPVESQSLTE